MRRSAVVGLAVVALVVGGASCGVPRDREARRIPADELPYGLGSPSLTTTEIPGTVLDEPLVDRVVDVHTVVEGRLVGTRVALGTPATIADVVGLVESPPRGTPGRTVLLPGDVVATSRQGTVVTIELLDTVLELPTAEQSLAVGQLVLTLTSLSGIDGVSFTVAGADAVVPLPDGSVGQGTITADDVSDLVRDTE